MNPRYIFFGSNEFSEITLNRLIESEMIPIFVITNPAKPLGRKQVLTPNGVQLLAEKHDILVMTPNSLKNEDFLKKIKQCNPDVAVVASYGKLIPKNVLDIPKRGFLNIHPSLLPKWRGASPIQSTILAGEEKTGITIMLMDETIDHGPIISQRELNIGGQNYSFEELSAILATMGAEVLIEVMPKWINRKIKAKAQKHSQATFCTKIDIGDSKINWLKPAEEIERLVLALNPEPGTYTFINDNGRPLMLKVLKVKIYQIPGDLPERRMGQVFQLPDKKMAVICQKDNLILETVHLEGRKPMTGTDFLMGHKHVIGQILS